MHKIILGYQCVCPIGFNKTVDQQGDSKCVDINECSFESKNLYYILSDKHDKRQN